MAARQSARAASVFDHPLPRLLQLLGVADRLGVLLHFAVESLGGGVLGVGPQDRAEVALRVVEVCELEVRACADQVALLAIRRIQQSAAHLLDDLLRGISDGTRDTLPTFEGKDPTRLRGQLAIAGEALASPRKLRNLLSIARGTRRAFKAMGFAHAALVPALARTLQDGY